jgi:hypothetical protein
LPRRTTCRRAVFTTSDFHGQNARRGNKLPLVALESLPNRRSGVIRSICTTESVSLNRAIRRICTSRHPAHGGLTLSTCAGSASGLQTVVNRGESVLSLLRFSCSAASSPRKQTSVALRANACWAPLLARSRANSGDTTQYSPFILQRIDRRCRSRSKHRLRTCSRISGTRCCQPS